MKIKIRPQSTRKKGEIKIEQFKRMIFHNFQKREQYCDITVLSTDDQTSVKAHQIILAAKMNNLDTSKMNSSVLQTGMDITNLRKIIDFCYTDEVCCDGISQTFNLLNFAIEYGMVDLIEKCRMYLNSMIVAKKPLDSKPSTMPQKLVIFGELGETDCFSATMLESIDGKWIELTEMNGLSQKYARQLTSVAYCGNDFVVVSGGLDKMKSKQQINLINLKMRKIESLPPMKTGRCEHASVVHNDFLYVAGGIKSGVQLDSVEKFDLKRRRWTRVRPMGKKRTLFAMIVAHDLIYEIGGENKFECMKSVEYYDPKEKLWKDTAPMIKPRASAGVAIFNNAIYAVGGSTMFNYGDTDTVERFDLNTKQWCMVASMNHSRYHVACCVYQNFLIAAGGYDFASHPVNFVEIYDEKTNKWIRSKAMNKPRGRCQMFVTSSNLETKRLH